MRTIIKRTAWICKYCEFVYCDEKVSRCDCLGYIGKNPPHFIKGEIKYSLLKITKTNKQNENTKN